VYSGAAGGVADGGGVGVRQHLLHLRRHIRPPAHRDQGPRSARV